MQTFHEQIIWVQRQKIHKQKYLESTTILFFTNKYKVSQSSLMNLNTQFAEELLSRQEWLNSRGTKQEGGKKKKEL